MGRPGQGDRETPPPPRPTGSLPASFVPYYLLFLIRFSLPDVSGYDTVLIGFPIWWYVAPTIINTFLEGCDLSDNRVAVFATSGGSGMGHTLDELKPSAPGAVWLSGKRFGNRESVSSLKAWIEGL